MSYDLDGNTLNDGTNSYVWDARNRLVSANSGGAAYAYDPLGRRILKTLLSSSTGFLYDGVNPVQELNGTTPTANLLTGGVDKRFQRTDATGTYSYLTDALGSTEALTDSTGAQQATYSYGPYGSMSITGSTTNSYGYTGRESDGLGIDYYRARYYNPATGRFISEDPMGFRAGPNFYAYVADSPLNFNDPFGLDRGPGGSGGGQGPSSPGCSGPECAALLLAPIASLENSFHNTVCAALSPLTSAAQGLGSTIGVGVGGNAGVGFILGVAVDGSVELVADRSGNVGLAITAGGNPGYGVFGIGGMRGVQASVSTVDSIYDLGGPTWDFGVSGTLPLAEGVAGPSVAADVEVSGPNATLNVTGGVGFGGRGAAFAGNYTFVPSFLSTNCQ